MAQLPEPTAKRLQRPSWRDARLLVGVVLVLLGTVLGARLIAAADDTMPMYAASTAIRPGDHLTTDNLRRVDVQLGDESARYLTATSAVPDDSYALRDIPEGELVPASAVGSRSTVRSSRSPSRSTPTRPVASRPAPWSTSGSARATSSRPRSATSTRRSPFSGSASRRSTRTPDGSAPRPSTMAVQLRVPRDKVAEVIAAVDKQSRFTLVPVPGQGTS